MAGGQSRKWMILVATVWIQAFTGTNFDFSAYSSDLKAALGISQVQLSYLATASDLGKALGWSSGLALLYLPLPAVLLLAAAFGAAAYAAQWLILTGRLSLPYLPVFLLCLLAGCSICWFNTVCFVLCIRNFPVNRSLALSLTISFNGVSAALYTLASNALDGSSSTYLLLNATLPVLASAAALLPILRQPPTHLLLLPPDATRRDSHVFLLLNLLAFLTGLYLLLLNSVSSNPVLARLLLAGAIILLLFPLCIPGIVCARDWARRTVYSRLGTNNHIEGVDLRKQLIRGTNININIHENDSNNGNGGGGSNDDRAVGEERPRWWCCEGLTEKNQLVAIGEEHSVKRLIGRIDFWLYYVAYFCGATVGLVYSNNLGQIAQSLGMESKTTMFVTVYSSCSFFGRLLSAAPDFLRGKVHFARTGWLGIALVPMPLAFFLLAEVGDGHALLAGTALVGLSSGFIFAAAVAVTSDLFGPNSVGVNHNILITNIPLGSLLYGLLAALVYDANGNSSSMEVLTGDGMVVCMGRKCYATTFLWWGCVTLVGLLSSLFLFLRTRPAYDQAEHGQPMPQSMGGEDFR
ncbi:protein NUCLEAR FUSION DEFECTIVE 4 [Elaeis guineensis]|uniref:Protein NUCLEAR FUSION DEFECTIVE 4 n=1 Tax=Elaeis guineensis var. tenera TaxID=51953 RepID=A0A6I9SH14_ELAGV|nr:protein NUCLEAR FUSION DEFECTIVE 4 [Elaeis guineensis]